MIKHNRVIEYEFLEKIHKHQGIIHKISLVYANSKEDKEDLYQEIVLQLWKSYSSFREQSSFSTWMYRVALNTAIGLTKRPRLFADGERSQALSYEMEHDMAMSEDVRILYKAISQLNNVEKAIVLLWLEEDSYDEIAKTVGISLKNVSVRLVRIKVKLAEIIKKYQ